MKHAEFSSSHGGYLLNTTMQVPGIGFSVADLDLPKFVFHRSQSFLFIVVIEISILIKTAFFSNFDSYLMVTRKSGIYLFTQSSERTRKLQSVLLIRQLMMNMR